MNMGVLKRYKWRILPLLFVIVLGCFLFFHVLIDDAFIAFRYGKNYINYGIWNFSPENDNVIEAYTSFIYCMISVIPAYFNIIPFYFYKLFSFVFFLLIIRMLFISINNKRLALFAISIFVLNWQSYVHTFSCLETIFWVWCLLEIFFIIKEDKISLTKQYYFWFLILLLPLTRPEGALIGFLIFLYLLFIRKIRINYIALIIFVSIGIFYFIVRYKYFGLLFPLPFYYKTVSKGGLLSFFLNLYTSWYYIITFILIVCLLRKKQVFIFTAITVGLIYFFLYSISALSMIYADRFPYQILFPLFLFSISFLDEVNEWVRAKIKWILISLITIIFYEGLHNNNFMEMASMNIMMNSSTYLYKSHVILAKHLKKLNNPKIKVLMGDAGVFSYYADIDNYDPNGLTNKYVALHGINKHYLHSIDVDIVMVTSFLSEQQFNDFLSTNSQFKSDIIQMIYNNKYEYIGYTIAKEEDYYVLLYINKKSQNYNQIKQAILDAIKESNDYKINLRQLLKYKDLRDFDKLD